MPPYSSIIFVGNASFSLAHSVTQSVSLTLVISYVNKEQPGAISQYRPFSLLFLSPSLSLSPAAGSGRVAHRNYGRGAHVIYGRMGAAKAGNPRPPLGPLPLRLRVPRRFLLALRPESYSCILRPKYLQTHVRVFLALRWCGWRAGGWVGGWVGGREVCSSVALPRSVFASTSVWRRDVERQK
jgi:hypothetical protein